MNIDLLFNIQCYEFYKGSAIAGIYLRHKREKVFHIWLSIKHKGLVVSILLLIGLIFVSLWLNLILLFNYASVRLRFNLALYFSLIFLK